MTAILDIAFTWKCSMDSSQILKHGLKVASAVIWIIVLPVCYARSRRKYTCYSTPYGTWLGEWCYSPYMVAVAFYLMTNAVHMVLFLVPAVGRYIETSNFRMCAILSWWTQVRFNHNATLHFQCFWINTSHIFKLCFHFEPAHFKRS